MPQPRYRDCSYDEFHKLSKRRQKIFIRRKLINHLTPLMGMEYNASSSHLMYETIKECLTCYIHRAPSVTFDVSLCRDDDIININASF